MRLRFDNLSAKIINIIDIDIDDIESLETHCGFWSEEFTFTFKDGTKDTYFDGDWRTDEEIGGGFRTTPREIIGFLKMWETTFPVGCYKSKRELQSAIDKNKVND